MAISSSHTVGADILQSQTAFSRWDSEGGAHPDELHAGVPELADIELVPSDSVDALLANENPMTVWRRHRGLSQTALADASCLSQAYIAQFDAGKREDAYNAIAAHRK